MDNKIEECWVKYNGVVYNPEEWDLLKWHAPKDAECTVIVPADSLSQGASLIREKVKKGQDVTQLLERYFAFSQKIADYYQAKAFREQLQKPGRQRSHMRVIDGMIVVLARVRDCWYLFDGLKAHLVYDLYREERFPGPDHPVKFIKIRSKISLFVRELERQGK